MTNREERPVRRKGGLLRPKAKSGVTENRQDRLAAALRENLQRRKKGKPGGKAD